MVIPRFFEGTLIFGAPPQNPKIRRFWEFPLFWVVPPKVRGWPKMGDLVVFPKPVFGEVPPQKVKKWPKMGFLAISQNPFFGEVPPQKWKNGPKSSFFKKWPLFPNPRDPPKSTKIDGFGRSVQKWVFGQKSTFLEVRRNRQKPSILVDFWRKCQKTPCLCPSYACIFAHQKSEKCEKTAFFGILLPVLCLFSPEHLLFGPFYIQKNEAGICTLFWNPILWKKEKWHFSML